MVAIFDWIIDNWKLIIPIGVLVIVLSMSGNITRTVRDAKRGLAQAVTPLGFVIFCIIAYLVYQIYLSIMETI